MAQAMGEVWTVRLDRLQALVESENKEMPDDEAAQAQVPIKRTAPDTIRSKEPSMRPLRPFGATWSRATCGRSGLRGAATPMLMAIWTSSLTMTNCGPPRSRTGGICRPHKGAVSHEKVVRFEPNHVLAFTFGEGRNGVATFELFAQGDRTAWS